MNFLDIILAIPLCFFIWKGYRKGLIYEVAALVGLVAGTYAAMRFSCFVAELLHVQGEASVLIAFFITFIAVVALSFLLGRVFVGIVKLIHAGFLNNLFGAVFGMLKCVCILSVLLYYVTIIDSHEVVLTADSKTESLLYKPINNTGNKLIGQLKTYVTNYRQEHPKEDAAASENETDKDSYKHSPEQQSSHHKSLKNSSTGPQKPHNH